MTNLIHTNNAFRNVGMIELVNEPESGHSSLVSTYYPTAWSKIRAKEDSLGVSSNNRLHIQMMSKNWGAGDPKSNLPSQTFAAYDYHRYVKWDTSVALNHNAYIAASCSDQVASDGDTPLIVGEWSLSVADSVESSNDWSPNNSANNAFYQNWFSAQIQAYEKQLGWVFWSWKAQLGDWRWSYVDAANAGIIPSDLDGAAKKSVC
jgi:glucan endo-1,6-beta-glucosidase